MSVPKKGTDFFFLVVYSLKLHKQNIVKDFLSDLFARSL